MDRARSAISAVANAPTYRFLQAGIFVVLGIAFATSFSSGSSGARILGYQERFIASVPLICDIVAALAMIVHGRVRDDRSMRRLAAWFVLVPMLLSWAANALDHLLRAPAQSQWAIWEQRGWIAGVIIFAGLAPVAVAGLLHFMAKYVEHQQRNAGAAKTANVEITVPEPEPEFVEPTPITAGRVIEIAPKVEVDEATVEEINGIEIAQVMREHRVERDVAEIMIRKQVSRATAYRHRSKGTTDAALA